MSKLIRTFHLLNVEWNSYNGLIFQLLHIEAQRTIFDSALFGVHCSWGSFFYIELFWMRFWLYDPNRFEDIDISDPDTSGIDWSLIEDDNSDEL